MRCAASQDTCPCTADRDVRGATRLAAIASSAVPSANPYRGSYLMHALFHMFASDLTGQSRISPPAGPTNAQSPSVVPNEEADGLRAPT